MTAKRRVAALESSLQPLDIVRHVLAEAHQHPGIDAYARSVAEQPVEAAPLSRIGTQVEASVRAAMKGKPRDEIDGAVRRAVGNAIFRYILFLRINTSALEIADREGLRAATCFYWMGCLLSGPREQDMAPGELAAHQAEQADAWRRWRGVVASLLVLVMVEEDAREQLEARYLAEQPALLADSHAAWDRFADLVDRLWALAENVCSDESTDGDTAPIDPQEVLAERVAERVQRLADDARVSAFERLGELPRAVAIVERRLRDVG